MALRLPKRFAALYVIFPVVLASALALGRYSYRWVEQLAGSEALIESNRVLGERTLDRIDSYIFDSDRQYFDLIDLERLSDIKRVWTSLVRMSPAIDAMVILDKDLQIVKDGYIPKKGGAEAQAFRNLFLKRILPDLHLADLNPDQHRHLHRKYDGRDYLLSFMKREEKGRAYYEVLKISLEYLERRFFPDELEKLRGKVLVCIRDADNRVIYGQSVGRAGKFLYEKSFPTTLYQWRLQMAPPEAARLLSEENARHRLESLLITLMLGTILVCILFLYYAISKEARANQLMSDFISNVSHELKTPLSLIRMFGELLALGKLKSPEKATEYAALITRESERLSRLIDNVLDFSRMERGKSAYDFQLGRLDEVVERALDVYRHRLEREGFRLTTKIDVGLPPTLIDENAMTLLLLNLLENAVKYGGGQIAVYLTQQGDTLRLVVGDQGPGIPHDEQRRIFDRFYRTRQARGTPVRGSGIGLSLVKHIAEAHGGRVTVESKPGFGAAFIVDIPLSLRREAA